MAKSVEKLVVYVAPIDLARLQHEADMRHISLSAWVRMILDWGRDLEGLPALAEVPPSGRQRLTRTA